MDHLSHFKSLWRSSANEAVAYSDDFSEALLVLPELIDGSLGDGKATEINIKFDITNSKSSILIVSDNGIGITSVKRLLDWASTNSASTEHVYGHGSKKCLTKFMPNYDDAKWSVKWRKVDKRGVCSSLNIVHSPFLGSQTKHDEDETDETTLMNSGTEWTINFDSSILKLSNVEPEKDLLNQLRELFNTRYETSYYNKFTINIEIVNRSIKICENSNSGKWLTLKQELDKDKKNISNILNKEFVIEYIDDINKNTNIINISIQFYKIISDGRKFKLKNFPVFGCKNMKGTRVHIGLKGRYIESMPFHNFMNKEIHNSDNGNIIFINFYSNNNVLPTPCTTKVKFQEECPIFKKCLIYIREIINKAEKDHVSPKPPPNPSPLKPEPTPTKPEPTPVKPEPTPVKQVPTPSISYKIKDIFKNVPKENKLLIKEYLNTYGIHKFTELIINN